MQKRELTKHGSYRDKIEIDFESSTPKDFWVCRRSGCVLLSADARNDIDAIFLVRRVFLRPEGSRHGER